MGSEDIGIDRGAVSAVTGALTDAGGSFDQIGRTLPAVVDAGLATEVVASMLATLGGCGARLVGANASLVLTGEQCIATYTGADVAAAERFLVTGGHPDAP
ncbi:hypothetical protein QE370_001837 [Aeromicrobium sp. SORGH_AS981]|jgi:hypothetical protein|uniref:hypothetical protein n=1 Tax=Aeromicrobium sp. SORGH_AS_0981 TaxID=3041802 RepID=UPI00285C182C|nr:hypothetical protein [Aeromicrobium sp. SORGH_AS_0981]MDR6118653.1 hypothetical protein [Aeromicrobium sp. SORGH_AS_0981]